MRIVRYLADVRGFDLAGEETRVLLGPEAAGVVPTLHQYLITVISATGGVFLQMSLPLRHSMALATSASLLLFQAPIDLGQRGA